ncbi:MAG: hypothetical protein ABIQ40_20520 [Bacteroidia bacterium]
MYIGVQAGFCRYYKNSVWNPPACILAGLYESIMELTELDKEYKEMQHFSTIEKMKYCEELITGMRSRLSDDFTDPNQIRSLVMEIIGAAEKEIKLLETEMKQVEK